MGSRESDVSHGPVRARSRPLRGTASADTCPRSPCVYKRAGRPFGGQQYTVVRHTKHTLRVALIVNRTHTQYLISVIAVASQLLHYRRLCVIIRIYTFYILFTSGQLRRNRDKIMAYLSNSFDFEHMQNSTNWEAVNNKRSFVARKMHKINKVSVVAYNILS